MFAPTLASGGEQTQGHAQVLRDLVGTQMRTRWAAYGGVGGPISAWRNDGANKDAMARAQVARGAGTRGPNSPLIHMRDAEPTLSLGAR